VHETVRAQLYAAVRDTDGAEVVLKCYHGDPVRNPQERARQEYDALLRVAGPGVVRTAELRLAGERPVLVLHWVHGVDLRALLDSRTLAPCEFLEIAVQLADALARVHAKRLIHRDLKPSNVVVDTRTLDTTIIDFGLALAYGSGINATEMGVQQRLRGHAALPRPRAARPQWTAASIFAPTCTRSARRCTTRGSATPPSRAPTRSS
jgi:serine/threonine protein kinase